MFRPLKALKLKTNNNPPIIVGQKAQKSNQSRKHADICYWDIVDMSRRSATALRNKPKQAETSLVTAFGSLSNKLAKLGDAIAISKSETINDPLADPLTDRGRC